MQRVPSGPVARIAVVGATVVVIVAAIGAVALGPTTHSNGPTNKQAVPAVANVTGGTAVTVRYATAENRTRQFVVEDVAPTAADTDRGWAYIPRSALPSALAGVAGDADRGVVAVGEWALVGDLTAATEQIGATEVTVVAPAVMSVDPARKAGFLAEFVSPYGLSQSTAPLTLVVAPDALPSAGRMYGTTGYVTQHAFWDGDVSSVWIHEFVHARRTFGLAPGMQWFSEASATYFSSRFMEEQFDGVAESDVRERIAATTPNEGVALANRTTWEGSQANYHRGAALLYVVDAQIRAGSGGDHSLVDVFRAMNREDDPVTVDEFVSLVERFSGRDADWVAQATREDVDLTPRVTAAGDAFADSPANTESS